MPPSVDWQLASNESTGSPRVAFADKNGRPPLIHNGFPEGEWLLKRAIELQVKANAPQPLILGRHLIDHGIQPGPDFGKIIEHCYQAQLDGHFTDLASGRAYLAKSIKLT